MSTNHIQCPEFHYGGDQLTLGPRWTTWNEQFELFLTATGISNDAKVKSLYLLGMGKEAFEIYKSKKKADSTDTLAEIRTFMSTHFNPKKSEYTEILTFRQAYRREGESVSEYVMRLRHLAADCKYGDNLEKEIERQFVVGCNMADVQRKCCRTDDLTLARVVEIAVGYERVDANTAKFRFSAEKPRQNINAINEARKPDDRRHSKAAYDASKCGNCNRPAHDDKSKCPAKGLACLKCGKLNHFAVVCRADAPTVARFRQGQTPAGRGQQQAPRQQISHVSQANPSTPANLTEAEADEYHRYKKCLDYGLNIFQIGEIGPYGRRVAYGPRTTATLQGLALQFLVDTGSPINIMGEALYTQLFANIPLEKPTTRYFGITAAKPLDVIGRLTAHIQHKDRDALTSFVIVKGDPPAIIGFHTASALNIVRFDATTIQDESPPSPAPATVSNHKDIADTSQSSPEPLHTPPHAAVTPAPDLSPTPASRSSSQRFSFLLKAPVELEAVSSNEAGGHPSPSDYLSPDKAAQHLWKTSKRARYRRRRKLRRLRTQESLQSSPDATTHQSSRIKRSAREDEMSNRIDITADKHIRTARTR